MRVVHFSASDRIGGASIMAYRLHKAMRLQGVDSHMLALDPLLTDAHIWTVRPLDRLLIKLANHWRAGKLPRNAFGLRWDRSGIDPLSYPLVRNSDVYFVHSSGDGLVGTGAVERLLQTGKPVFIYLHDLSPVTGGCSCPMGCPSLETGCNDCPAGGGRRVAKSAARKREVYRHYPNLHILAGSHGVRQLAQAAWACKGLSVQLLAPTLDTELFSPRQRATFRWLFGLSKRAKCLLFVGDTRSPEQGWDRLQAALSQLKLYEWSVVLLGSSDVWGDNAPFPCKRVVALDRLYDEASLAALYNAVDLTVVPSLRGGFGRVAIESICCGTPVVGLDYGGLSDWVQHGLNGYLAKVEGLQDATVLQLSEAIQRGVEQTLSYEQRMEIATAMAARVGYEKVVPALIQGLQSLTRKVGLT